MDKLHRHAASIIEGYTVSQSQMSRTFGWPTLQSRRDYLKCMLLFKSLHGLAPAYLMNLAPLATSFHDSRVMHVFCWQTHLVEKRHLFRYNHPHILCMSSKSLQSDDRLLCDIKISGKTRNYCLKSVCNFKVSRSSLILLCKQHNWTLGTYSIEI